MNALPTPIEWLCKAEWEMRESIDQMKRDLKRAKELYKSDLNQPVRITEACDRLGVICKPSVLKLYKYDEMPLTEWHNLFIALGVLDEKRCSNS